MRELNEQRHAILQERKNRTRQVAVCPASPTHGMRASATRSRRGPQLPSPTQQQAVTLAPRLPCPARSTKAERKGKLADASHGGAALAPTDRPESAQSLARRTNSGLSARGRLPSLPVACHHSFPSWGAQDAAAARMHSLLTRPMRSVPRAHRPGCAAKEGACA